MTMERPIITPGPAGMCLIKHLEFHTERQPWPVQKCHVNAMVADTETREQAAATTLDAHPGVVRRVKIDHLGFTVPYRSKEGSRRQYLPDFIVETVGGDRIVVEIKGQVGDAEMKAAAAQRWCQAVNNGGWFGGWSYGVVRPHPD
jgi:type III restriction enzyme